MERENGERTQEWQEWMLSRLVEKTFVRTSQGVKGPYTTGTFVVWLLNTIFGPANWSHRVLRGPELIKYGDQQGYSQVTVQLSVRFANGQEVIHEDIGIWPMTATGARDGGTLEQTKPERFEQVVKSAVTDGLKACTDYLGNCFRPIGTADPELEGVLRRRQASESLKDKGKSAAGEPPVKSNDDLFGTEEPQAQPTSASPPKDITELYKRADDELGFSPKDAAATLSAWLEEHHATKNIGAYLKNGGADAVATLWQVLQQSV